MKNQELDSNLFIFASPGVLRDNMFSGQGGLNRSGANLVRLFYLDPNYTKNTKNILKNVKWTIFGPSKMVKKAFWNKNNII